MKITIDTKEDSHEEIRKVIKMLQHLVGEQSYTNEPDIFGDSPPSTEKEQTGTTNAFTNMFGSAEEDKPKEEPMEEPKEEKEEIPEVVPY